MHFEKRDLLIVLAIIPVVVLILTTAILLLIERNSIKNQYNLDSKQTFAVTDLFDEDKITDMVTDNIYKEIKVNSENSVNIWDNDAYMVQLNEQFSKVGGFVAVNREDFGAYFNQYDTNVIMGYCKTYQMIASKNDCVSVTLHNRTYSIKEVVFAQENQKPIYVNLICNDSYQLPHIQPLIWKIIAVNCVVFALLSLVILLIMHYDIVIPIRTLELNVNGLEKKGFDVEMQHCSGHLFGDLQDGLDDLQQAVVKENKKREETDTLTREVIGNISHDLKTPLTAIKGYAEGVLDGVARSQEQVDRYIKTIYNKAVDMNVLVDELAFFTKINQNDLPYKFSAVNINQYMSACLSTLVLDLDMKKIQLIYRNKTDKDTMVYIDDEKIKRVVHNIIGNAGKYIQREEGFIYVTVEDYGKMVLVRIEDNGRGIAPEELPHIFDRFYRTDSSRNSKTGGSGLGLAIAQKIILDHGGKIWAESKIDVGTALIFTLKKQ